MNLFIETATPAGSQWVIAYVRSEDGDRPPESIIEALCSEARSRRLKVPQLAGLVRVEEHSDTHGAGLLLCFKSTKAKEKALNGRDWRLLFFIENLLNTVQISTRNRHLIPAAA